MRDLRAWDGTAREVPPWLPDLFVKFHESDIEAWDEAVADATGAAPSAEADLFSGAEPWLLTPAPIGDDPTPLTLSFGVSEVISLAIAVALAAYMAIDGVTSWLEGAQLLALWGMLALWFYFFQPWPHPIR